MEFTYKDYLQFLSELSKALSDLTVIQDEKTKAVKLHRIDELNGAIKKEQALSLYLRGLDKKRKTILNSLNITASLRDMPNICEDVYKKETRIAVDEIVKKSDVLDLSRKTAANIIEQNSRLIEKALRARGVNTGEDDLPDILPGAQANPRNKYN